MERRARTRRQGYICVYFNTGPVLSGMTLRQRIVYLRNTRRCVSWMLAVLTRTLTRDHHSHVAVSVRKLVLDPCWTGDRIRKIAAYLKSKPTLAYIVPVERFIELDGPCRRHRKPIIPSLVRLFTRGRVHAPNCVTRVASVLRLCGVPAPDNIVTPKQLAAFLEAQGGVRVDLVAG